ncbi:surface carbohydrate biosynthesis protein [Acinetobacter indicus]|uniref:surface carbohydrate biosynthesis protein n=1 Tax=Acinetobacter indicus TaxID=756892 RepID=UPI000CEC2137|nr:surface carbohydrate biosynthesis protein [Acinetobacter indicus]
MNIMIPVETINRELDSKLILASFLVKSGAKVYIGQHDYLHSLVPYFKNGLYIGKNVFKTFLSEEKFDRLYDLKKQNIDIFYLHEEGAVFPGGKEDWEEVLGRQYSTEYFGENDLVLTWGNFQKNYDTQRTKNSSVVATGHPRFDLYKKKYRNYFSEEIAQLKEKYGNYILVNGNYGLVNHGLGLNYVFSKSHSYNPANTRERLKRVGFYRSSSAQMNAIIELVHHLAVVFSDKNIIYRSHPSESDDIYKQVFQGVSNIHVVHEGGVAPWILGAEAIIHDGCTTAIEAFISDKKVINYKADIEDKFNIWLPNQMGVKATDISGVINVLNEKEVGSNVELDFEVTELLCNFHEDSIDNIVNLVNKHMELNNEEKKYISPSDFIIRRNYSFMEIRRVLSYIKYLGKNIDQKYHTKKFNGFDKKEIASKLGRATEISGGNINLKFYNKLMFSLSSSID